MRTTELERHPTVRLAMELIRRPSVTPEDGGCQEQLIERLERLGFQIERLPFGDVSNFWARRGRETPLFAFAGHTDVVPAGAMEEWSHPPFVPTIDDARLYGRGAADMKGSLAAMLVATERFIEARPIHCGSIGFLVTSDEEGDAIDGTTRVVDLLVERGETIDFCLVGEPSSSERTGDVVRNGRRGSLNGRLEITGVQGHVAYPEAADNPIHRALSALKALVDEPWDEGNAFFPPTSLQISNVQAGTGATNVIPSQLVALFNVRFSSATTADAIRRRCEAILAGHDLSHRLEWTLSGEPFLTESGALIDAARRVIERKMGFAPELSTSGGTSDGRFIAPTGAEVLELGPCNATIHKVDEHVRLTDLIDLTDIYGGLLLELLPP
jgi:succinyl-diaminopimelate desuccinylase